MAAELRLIAIESCAFVLFGHCIFFCGFLQCSRSQGRTPVKGRGDPEFGSTDTCPEGAFVVRFLGSLPRRVRLCAFCSSVCILGLSPLVLCIFGFYPPFFSLTADASKVEEASRREGG